jgi:tyrosyl-tRNA synthetase
MTTSSGAKMGKTATGAIWLDQEQLSAYDFWQYWRNTEDADVGRFMRLFTELPLDEITRLEKLQDAEINEAKKILAGEVTKLCHGEDAAKLAAKTAEDTFEGAGISADLPTIELTKSDLEAGITAFELFRQAGLANSNGEARRLIKGNGAKLNDSVIADESQMITLADNNADGVIKLSAGKKRHILIRATE